MNSRPDWFDAHVTNYAASTVSVINEATNTVTATIPVGRYPFGIAVDSSSRTAYPPSAYDNTMSVIDGATNSVTGTIPVGRFPVGVDSTTSSPLPRPTVTFTF
ncbi:MAG: hypothetical protein JO296_13015 [Pseudonocardiales bacterium]|nr:hypothetical protein [Pseudonocardiales bacterium]